MTDLMTDFHVIIPARYQSSRLPGKPLKIIGDKAMIIHVCDRAKESGAQSITVATDNQQIYALVKQHGYQAVITDEAHPSGSDRLFQAAQILQLNDDDIIVNLQGDEPFIAAENIALPAKLLQRNNSQMSTLASPIKTHAELNQPSVVKVVINKHHQAIYFSRLPIPYNSKQTVSVSEQLKDNYWRHIGIYAYRKSFLAKYVSWKAGQLELAESLEQLRVLENGYSIYVGCLSESPAHGVDTAEDLQNARIFYKNNYQQRG